MQTMVNRSRKLDELTIQKIKKVNRQYKKYNKGLNKN